MKRKFAYFVLSVIAGFLTFASAAIAGNDPICYHVGGTVEMENVSDVVQVGAIHLVLTNNLTGVTEFDETGDLVGSVTGQDMATGTTFLSHSAQFSAGNKFTTTGDAAVLNFNNEETPGNPIRYSVLDENGTPIPCSFWIYEKLTNLKKASRFFAKARKLDQNIEATGFVSNCPGENLNYFVLTGEFCRK